MDKMRLAFTLMAATFSSGCAHSIHQLYISSMDHDQSYQKGKWIQVEAKDFVVLGFQMETDYVEQAFKKLEKQCPGRLAQVTTEHLTSFQFLSYDQRVVLKGFCVG